jgi:hypothetical protein
MNYYLFPVQWCAPALAISLVLLGSTVRAEDSNVASNASSQTTNAASTTMLPSKRGTWVWRKQSWLTQADRDALFSFLRKQGISVILVQIHTDYSGEKPVLQNQEELSALLREAASQHIVVHALDGDPSYIYPPWPEKLSGQIRAVAALNASLTGNGRFTGVHYDIEPYILPAYKKEETRLDVCKAYLTALQTLAQTARAQGLEFSVDIPMFFATSEKRKYLETDEEPDTLLGHVAHIVDWFGLMAYRNKASGPDGILAHSEPDIAVMEKLGKKAWIGVETGPNRGDDPPKITFRNRPVAEFDAEIKEVESKMAGQKGYGGLLIHSYELYREYLGQTPVAKP